MPRGRKAHGRRPPTPFQEAHVPFSSKATRRRSWEPVWDGIGCLRDHILQLTMLLISPALPPRWTRPGIANHTANSIRSNMFPIDSFPPRKRLRLANPIRMRQRDFFGTGGVRILLTLTIITSFNLNGREIPDYSDNSSLFLEMSGRFKRIMATGFSLF